MFWMEMVFVGGRDGGEGDVKTCEGSTREEALWNYDLGENENRNGYLTDVLREWHLRSIMS